MAKDKRKYDALSDADVIGSVPVKAVNQPATIVAVNTDVPEDAKFNIYASKQSGKSLVTGQSSDLEYEGSSEKSVGSYALASYDASKNEIRIFPASVVKLDTVVRSKKQADIEKAIKQANVRASIQRNALGEQFGTKKAKKVITDLERNRIDAGQLEDLESAIVDTVKTSTESLPSQEERKATQSQERPIPAYDLDTTKVEEIYPVKSILPKKELAAIRVTAIAHEPDVAKQQALLPHKTSTYIAAKLAGVQASQLSSGDRVEKIKLIYYASLLLAVYDNRRVSNKVGLTARVGTPADILVDGIIERFTTNRAGHVGKSKERSFVIDPAHESKLLCYFLALALRLDNYVLELGPLANELSMKPSKLTELVRALGCQVKNANAGQVEALGLAGGVGAGHKLAVLTAPLKLPEVAKRKRQGGR